MKVATVKRVLVTDILAGAGVDIRGVGRLRATVLVDAAGKDAAVAVATVRAAADSAVLDVDGAVRSCHTRRRQRRVSSYVATDGVVELSLIHI